MMVKTKPILIEQRYHPSEYLEMPEGLQGYWWEVGDEICVPLVIADEEGSGKFTKFVSELEQKGKTVFFPCIISARLEAILRARGYVDAGVIDEEMGFVDGLAKLLVIKSKRKV